MMMNLIEQLEKNWRNELSAEEKDQLLQLLALDPAAAQEAQAYHQLWDGLAALQQQHWHQQMENWQQDWQAADETELMEAYWNDDLNPLARQALVQRAAQDPQYQQELTQHGQLQQALRSANDAAFADRLRQWSAEESTPAAVPAKAAEPAHSARIVTMRRRIMRWSAAAAILLVCCFIGARWYADANYTDLALVQAAYQSPSLGATMGQAGPDENTSPESLLMTAHQAIKNEQYAEAIKLFDLIPQLNTFASLDELSQKNIQQNIAWNRLLAQLALGQTPETDLQAQLAVMAQEPGHAYAKQAQQLLRKLNSPWRTF